MSRSTKPTDIELLLTDIRDTVRSRVTAIVEEEAEFARARVAIRVNKALAEFKAEAHARFNREAFGMEISIVLPHMEKKENG